MSRARPRWLALLPVLLLAALALLLYVGMQDVDRALPSPLIGKPAPPLPGEDGTQAAASLTDGGPMLVNFWASWCQPCLVEHPMLMDLAAQGVRVIGVNYKDQVSAASRWLQRHGDPFALVLRDEQGRFAIEWGVYGVPETFLVDGDGVIRLKHVGPLDGRFFAHAEIQSLLAAERR